MSKIYNRRWSKERGRFLQDNPLCAYCMEQGKIKPANVVDHIVPHKGDMDLFWDKANWQPLCKRCHDSVKQREERTGSRIGCDVDGIPFHWGKK